MNGEAYGSVFQRSREIQSQRPREARAKILGTIKKLTADRFGLVFDILTDALQKLGAGITKQGVNLGDLREQLTIAFAWCRTRSQNPEKIVH